MDPAIEPPEQSPASIEPCRLAVDPASPHGSQSQSDAMAVEAPVRRAQIRPTTKIRLKHQALLSVPRRRKPAPCGYLQIPGRIS